MLTLKLKIRYIEMALAIQHIHLKTSDVEKIISTYELITEKGGNANVKDLAILSNDIDQKYFKMTQAEKIDF